MSKERIFIVHCWGGRPDYAWYPWAKQEFEKIKTPDGAQRFDVIVPALPNTDNPQVNEWVPALRREVGQPTKDDYILTHSLGGITVLHYLDELAHGVEIGGMAMFAPNTTDVGYPDEIGTFFNPMPDIAQARSHLIRPARLFYSSDDQYVPAEQVIQLARDLDGTSTPLENRGHFSGPLGDPSSCTELPEAVAAIRHLAG